MTPNVPPIGEDDLLAFVDGRLDATRRATVEAYLAANPEVRERVEADRRHNAALRAALDPVFDEPVPARLRISSIRAGRAQRQAQFMRVAAAAVALLCVGAAGGFIGRGLVMPNDDGHLVASGPSGIPTTQVARAATSAFRTYVVEVVHPVEVKASQESHLLQWLSKRLGRPLSAPDLAGFGYHLMGGRLLPARQGAAAQLMYEDQSGRRLTLYVAAADGTETSFQFAQEGDMATFSWIDQGFGFAVTGMETRARLLPIAEAVYHSLGDGAAPSRAG